MRYAVLHWAERGREREKAAIVMRVCPVAEGAEHAKRAPNGHALRERGVEQVDPLREGLDGGAWARGRESRGALGVRALCRAHGQRELLHHELALAGLEVP